MTNELNKRALILDRDGVINLDKHYVHRIADFEFTEDIFTFCQKAESLGYLLIVVTNQAGVGRGIYNEHDYEVLTEWMIDQFRAHDVCITKVYKCFSHSTHGLGAYKRDSFNRKPNPGMILGAAEDYDLDLQKCILIGDKETDITAGIRAKVGLNIMLRTGKYTGDTNADLIVQNLQEATDWISTQS